MRFAELGRTGTQVSLIGQGTFDMEKDKRQSTAALHRGIELGMTHIDTAEMYGSGRCEAFLGEALQGKREQVFLVSKVLPENASYEGTIQACERSLSRLRTDYLDCYLLHWEEHHPFAETLRAFEKLEKDGKIRSFGVSNFELEEMRRAVELAGEGRIAMNQVEYHLKRRGIERRLIPWCRHHGVSVVGYSPFGDNRFPHPLSRQGRLLKRIGDEHGLSPRCAALAFLLREEGVFLIPKASKLPHVEDNARGAEATLPHDVLAELDRLFPID